MSQHPLYVTIKFLPHGGSEKSSTTAILPMQPKSFCSLGRYYIPDSNHTSSESWCFQTSNAVDLSASLVSRDTSKLGLLRAATDPFPLEEPFAAIPPLVRRRQINLINTIGNLFLC